MNAASLRAFDDLSAAAGRALWPATVTIAGIPGALAATVVRPRQGISLGLYANEPDTVTLPVRISKQVLPTAPPLHAILTWDGKKWKIMHLLGQEASEAQWLLDCQPCP